MEKRRASERGDRGTNIGGGKDVDSKDIGNGTFKVVSVESRDEDLTLLIEDKDSRNHLSLSFR